MSRCLCCTQAFPRHSLSRAALITSGSPIFLLDTFTSIIVYYAPHAPAALPYPPPQVRNNFIGPVHSNQKKRSQPVNSQRHA